MNLLYSGGTFCSGPTLKRLLLVANEIGFMDRPSITFPGWGTVGHESQVRRIDASNFPVALTPFRPPSGPVTKLYLQYLEADLRNTAFIETFLRDLRQDEFAWRFLQANANYGQATGKAIRDALVADEALKVGPYGVPNGDDIKHEISTTEARRATLRVLLAEASFSVTNSLVVAGKTGLYPVTDSPGFMRLMRVRTAGDHYHSRPSAISPQLAIAVATSVIPDEVLQEINLDAIGEYREKSKDAYDAWTIEIDALATKINNLDPADIERELERIVLSEVRPRIAEYRKSMESSRDKLFGDLIKKVTKWEVPTLSLGFLTGIDLTTAIVAFATALAPAVPEVVDYFVEARKIKRQNSMSYLVGVSKLPPS